MIEQPDRSLAAGASTMRMIRRGRRWLLGSGLRLTMRGVAAMLWPVMARLATEVFVGWRLVFGGVSQMIEIC